MLAYFSMVGSTIISYGVFLPFMSNDLGWSRSALSGPYTVFWIVVGLLGPVVGVSVHRFGSRKNIIFGHLAITLGLLAMPLVTEVWHVYLFFSIIAGTGQAFGGYIAITTIANNWFIRRRSLAVGLISAAGGIGGLTVAPLISWVISQVGWQLGWIYLAAVPLVMAVLVSGILVRNKPEDVGQVADGVRETDDTASENEADIALPGHQINWRARDALRTPTLWLIVTFVAANLFGLNLLTLHQVSYLRDLGFSAMTAATTIGVMALMSVVGQLSCGVLGIKIKGKYLATACLTLFIMGITILMNVEVLPLIYVHTVLSGIGYGGLLMLPPVLIGAYFGRRDYAKILGWTVPVTTIFSSISPVFGGLIYDAIGNYNIAFIVVISFLVVGLVCSILARPPRSPMGLVS